MNIINNKNSLVKKEFIDYGEVLHSTILKIFGDEMTYNELKIYDKDEDDSSYLVVEHLYFYKDHIQLIAVFINNKKVLEKEYSFYHSCTMFYYLNELKYELNIEDEDDEDDKNNKDDENNDNDDEN